MRFKRGDLVRIKTWGQIAKQLDGSCAFEKLPFQPEMRRYCGSLARVLNPIRKLVVENAAEELRSIRNTVLLEDIRCDGSAHGGCGRACLFLWKEEWLDSAGASDEDAPSCDASASDADADTASYKPSSRACQSAALAEATSPIPTWSIMPYVWDMLDSSRPLTKRILHVAYSLARRMKNSVGIRLPLRKHPAAFGMPPESFDLEPGDLVEAKSYGEIKSTLDALGKNRGLSFTREMRKFCGCKFRVLKPVEGIIIEGTARFREIAQTYLLEGATCDGSAHFGCPRRCYLMWRKVWLRKVHKGDQEP